MATNENTRWIVGTGVVLVIAIVDAVGNGVWYLSSTQTTTEDRLTANITAAEGRLTQRIDQVDERLTGDLHEVEGESARLAAIVKTSSTPTQWIALPGKGTLAEVMTDFKTGTVDAIRCDSNYAYTRRYCRLDNGADIVDSTHVAAPFRSYDNFSFRSDRIQAY